MAANLQFSTFVFPCNPESCRLSYHRSYKVEVNDSGSWTATKGVRLSRRMECKGCFCGENAYDQFKTLSALFMNGSTGALVHPQWTQFSAFIAELEVLEEPQENFLQYRVLFVELSNSD